jgi:hypothetical protein
MIGSAPIEWLYVFLVVVNIVLNWFDLFTTSLAGYEHERNPIIKKAWQHFGFPILWVLKTAYIIFASAVWFSGMKCPQTAPFFLITAAFSLMLLTLVCANNAYWVFIRGLGRGYEFLDWLADSWASRPKGG